MKLGENTVLITGGATGIGFALAQRFAAANSQVIVCGRRPDALEEAKRTIAGLETIQCDVSMEDQRVALLERVKRDFPSLNVLVNNAGIQNRPPTITQTQDWSAHRREIATNLEAPHHLTLLFAPFLLNQNAPAIINVTSGLAFVPIAAMPTYCATKAAMHSLTESVRWQLRDTPIQVIEMAPPAVQTDLAGKGLHTFGVPLEEFADAAMKHLESGDLEFGYGFSEQGLRASPDERKAIFERMNSRA